MAYLLHFSVPPYRKEENIKELEIFTYKKSSTRPGTDCRYCSPHNQSQVPIVFVKGHWIEVCSLVLKDPTSKKFLQIEVHWSPINFARQTIHWHASGHLWQAFGIPWPCYLAWLAVNCVGQKRVRVRYSLHNFVTFWPEEEDWRKWMFC